jgi:DNA-binding NtrC family response regulator
VASKEREDDSSDDFGSSSQDPTLIYRALVEMRTDLSDLKKMLAKFIYSSFSNKDIKALPEAMPRDFDPNDISVYTNKHGEESLGIRSMDTGLDDDDVDDEPSINSFFTDDDIPSIEKAEKFLIQQALKKFEGNRRKASEALGVSERTLYRKLDQYELQ